ncbi:hypothetical protein [Dictyobacter vulcani]|uniref:hypothetical protein n=1 Tax=Dictyobacter vulcani TaxID=2607529 RepID=UPI0013866881|nr:hypothetical protein [Dictyobacter vulcani]
MCWRCGRIVGKCPIVLAHRQPFSTDNFRRSAAFQVPTDQERAHPAPLLKRLFPADDPPPITLHPAPTAIHVDHNSQRCSGSSALPDR